MTALDVRLLAKVREVLRLQRQGTTRAHATEACRQMEMLRLEAERDWRVAMAILELRYPEPWGDPETRQANRHVS